MNIYALVLIIAAMYAIYKLGRYQENVEMRLQALEKAVEENKKAAAPKAHTQSMVECLEDAMAVLIDADFTAAELQARIDTAERILRAGRKSPHSYKEDKPSKPRNRRVQI